MILDTIVARKQQEVAALRRQGLPAKKPDIAPPRGFIRALCSQPGVAIIAEIKKASPSKGVIQSDFDPVHIAHSYRAGGAQALSVLTDVNFFQGAVSYIPLVRAAVELPVLRKDFIIDPLQVQEAALLGADAVLLIAAILDPTQLRDFQELARSLGMDVLVEVHNEQELEVALTVDSKLIGINNRNLQDFSVDLATTFRLKPLIPPQIPVVSESGITSAADMQRLREVGVSAALIGESLMCAEAKETLLQDFLRV